MKPSATQRQCCAFLAFFLAFFGRSVFFFAQLTMGKKSKSGHGGKAKQSQVAAAAAALPVGMSGPVVGRCKLDPGLKAPPGFKV